jgi:uncharacterized membrane protein
MKNSNIHSRSRRAKTADSRSAEERNIESIIGLETSLNTHRTFGERVADGFAAIVGSWTFIVVQSLLLAAWIALNVVGYIRAWDPYPFILLNLALSFQAAYATPIIMMSQNRQAKIADLRNHLDLQINLLAEQESTETLRLLDRLCKHLQVDISDEAPEPLEMDVSPEKLASQLAKAARETEKPH